ncbi:uncharacterized protein LOC129322993 isoform X2 [Prosopis cineraria]|uniref:uncharacterized protein LOC129322993 isoform X2 n=1 Tax=Prosopis cineraria TaxID=364024 RepID=UPI00240F2EE8|nr:uncharacterized protein LOC129322993 isoform X2 [Prosopis cineraria]XP_054825485.1 uncharacterized protein LOC129322993 isoform X2 [Prosopis cineraria]XP_054825494.1 uncharacterized protein LOC129322993 isoform X2 [Prosopis cineraria]
MDLAKPKHDAMERHGRRDLMYLEHHIHSLEIEAYSSVLKAFIAQSDLLSWGKEGLISDLRKELNVTDAEHGAILIAVNSDESVKRIREQRTLPTHAENCVKVNNPRHGSGSVQNSSIMMKTSSPFAYLPQKNMLLCQSSHAAFPIPSSVPPKFKADRKTAELAMFSCGSSEQSAGMIKHKVQGLGKIKHQLEKGFDKSGFSNIESRSNVTEMHATNRVTLNSRLPQSTLFCWRSHISMLMTTISYVEKMLFDGEKLDPIVVDKAKCTLREQERAILEALAKLTDKL